jgi:hypothetical protein
MRAQQKLQDQLCMTVKILQLLHIGFKHMHLNYISWKLSFAIIGHLKTRSNTKIEDLLATTGKLMQQCMTVLMRINAYASLVPRPSHWTQLHA